MQMKVFNRENIRKREKKNYQEFYLKNTDRKKWFFKKKS